MGIQFKCRGGGMMKMVEVKIKNKPNELKAVAYLGGYSQHKGLLAEVIKTLDWFDEVDKKIKNKEVA